MSLRATLLISLLAFAALSAALARAQAPPQYTAEEYQAYQTATTEADLPKRLELLMTFLKDRPQSTLRQHIVAAYQQSMNELQTGEKWPEIARIGDHFLTIVPDDIYTLSMLTTAHQKLGNHKQFVVYGERVFAANPSENLAYYLTKAYSTLGTDAKFFEYGEKVATMMPGNHEILLELTKKSVEAKRAPQAAKYARQCIKAMQEATKPAETPAKTWRDYQTHVFATCFAIVGNYAFERQDYAGAISSLEASLKHYARNEIAYYYLAQSYWQQGKLDSAMKNFAKAYLLKGKVSAPAKQHLDNLYKSTHQNSLVGQERVIDKARQELP